MSNATTTAQPPATVPDAPTVPDDLGIACEISLGLGSLDYEFDHYNTVGELKRSYRKVFRHNSRAQDYWPRLVFAGVDGQEYAAEIDVAKRDVVIRLATDDDLHQAEVEMQEYTRSIDEIVAKAWPSGYSPNK